MMRIVFLISFSILSNISFSQETNYYKSFASPREQAFTNDFFVNCFLQGSPSPGIYRVYQEYPFILLNQSVGRETIEIGGKIYEHGIGVHANSEIKVSLPGQAKAFTCVIGKDINEYSIKAPEQKLIFSLLSEGKEIWKSKPTGLKEGGVKINIPLKGITEFNLKASAVGDNNYGHADWANAMVEMADGKKIFLDQLGMSDPGLVGIPFSFSLGEKPSTDFLKSWKMQSVKNKLVDRVNYTITWTKPENDFQVRAEAVQFLNHPAVEWKLYFKNTGTSNSEVLKNIRSLNIGFNEGGKDAAKNAFGLLPNKVHYNRGSGPSQYDFQPISSILLNDESIRLKTNEGRASESYIPFWNLDYNNFGWVGALGWSGSWDAEFYYYKNNNTTYMKAGPTHIETFLKPGEEIMAPSVCLLYWEGNDAQRGNNLFRRYMKDIWVPKLQGKDPIMLATMGNPSATTGIENVNEQNQLEYIRKVSEAGLETYWLDAGWNEDGSNGSWGTARGNWSHHKKKFPNGLKPISDEAHKNGMKFMLWFDPECVTGGTEIGVKHPEWVIWGDEKKSYGLFNLGNPDALKYLTDMMDTRIKEYGVDIFRTDYNVDPKHLWDKLDEPGRKGITEVKYVQNLYKFWDELLKRNPGLLIDNCASGGKRIEYETSKRGVPFWRSDIECFTDSMTMTESQNQNYGLSYFLPNQSTGNKFSSKIYDYRSIAGTGTVFINERDASKPLEIPIQELKKAVSEIKSYNYLFQADYYPLTKYCPGKECWMALQYDSPERGEGLVTIFRRENAPYSEAEFVLKALDPKAKYTLTYIDSGKEVTGSAEQIKNLTIRLNKGTSAIVKYKKLK